jgi:aspartate kinase
VPFQVRSTFRKKGGTLVEGKPIEQDPVVAAVTGLPHVAYVRLSGITAGADRAELFQAIDRLLDDADTVAGLCVEEGPGSGTISFHLPMNRHVAEALEQMAALARNHGGSAGVETGLAAVTLVGTGLLDAPAIAARATRSLASASVVLRAVSSGHLSLTLLVSEPDYLEAQRALHGEFLE